MDHAEAEDQGCDKYKVFVHCALSFRRGVTSEVEIHDTPYDQHTHEYHRQTTRDDIGAIASFPDLVIAVGDKEQDHVKQAAREKQHNPGRDSPL